MTALNLDSSKQQSSPVKTKTPGTAEDLQSKRERDRACAKMRINIDVAFERW